LSETRQDGGYKHSLENMNESNGDFAFWTARSISPAGVALVTASFDRILSITMCDIDHWKLTRRSRGAHALAALMALARPVVRITTQLEPALDCRTMFWFPGSLK